MKLLRTKGTLYDEVLYDRGDKPILCCMCGNVSSLVWIKGGEFLCLQCRKRNDEAIFKK